MQIAAVMEDAGSRAGLVTVCTYGGVPKHTQAAVLRKGVHVIVATPGRLKVRPCAANRPVFFAASTSRLKLASRRQCAQTALLQHPRSAV